LQNGVQFSRRFSSTLLVSLLIKITDFFIISWTPFWFYKLNNFSRLFKAKLLFFIYTWMVFISSSKNDECFCEKLIKCWNTLRFIGNIIIDTRKTLLGGKILTFHYIFERLLSQPITSELHLETYWKTIPRAVSNIFLFTKRLTFLKTDFRNGIYTWEIINLSSFFHHDIT